MSTRQTLITKALALALVITFAPNVLADIEIEPNGVVLDIEIEPNGVVLDIEIEPNGATMPFDIETEPNGLSTT